jgi:hypothetical protein
VVAKPLGGTQVVKAFEVLKMPKPDISKPRGDDGADLYTKSGTEPVYDEEGVQLRPETLTRFVSSR